MERDYLGSQVSALSLWILPFHGPVKFFTTCTHLNHGEGIPFLSSRAEQVLAGSRRLLCCLPMPSLTDCLSPCHLLHAHTYTCSSC